MPLLASVFISFVRIRLLQSEDFKFFNCFSSFVHGVHVCLSLFYAGVQSRSHCANVAVHKVDIVRREDVGVGRFAQWATIAGQIHQYHLR